MPKRFQRPGKYKSFDRSATKTQVYTIANISSLSSFHPSLIDDEHFANTQNMIRRRDGLFENRKGYTQFGANVGSGIGIHSLRFWRKSDGDAHLTVGTGTKLYSYAEGAEYNAGQFTARADVLTLSGQGANPDDVYSFDSGVYRDTLILTNGYTKLITTTDNETFNHKGGSIVAAHIEIANDFVSYTGIPDNRSLLKAADAIPADPTVINDGNDANIDLNNGQTIKGHRALGANIVIYKEASAYALAIADSSISRLDYNGGCLSNRSILQTELNEVLAAGRQGIFSIKKTQIGDNRLFGASESQLVDDIYKSTIDYKQINAVYDPSSNIAIWTLNTNTGVKSLVKHMNFDKSWTVFSGINSSDWTIYYSQDDIPHLLFADKSTDRIFEMFKGRSDNGSAIEAILETKRIDFGQPGIQKEVQYFDLLGYMSANAEWKIEVFKDDDVDNPIITQTITNVLNGEVELLEAQLGVGDLGANPVGGFVDDTSDLAVYPIKKRIMVNASLENIQIRLTNNQKDARVVFKAIPIYFSFGGQDEFPYEDIL